MRRFARWIEESPKRHACALAITLLALLAALLLVSGCAVGGEDPSATVKPSETPSVASLDPAGKTACDKFARWLADGSDRATREKVAKQVDKLASTSKSGEIADKGELLASSNVVRANENFALAADSFAYECQTLGWKP